MSTNMYVTVVIDHPVETVRARLLDRTLLTRLAEL
jgi:hypothetical protein